MQTNQKENIMKQILLITSFIALAMATRLPIRAAEQGESPTVLLAATNTVRATVQDINHKKRELTLKGPEGNTMKIKVGEGAKNFSQIQKGDTVVASYYEAAAISLAEPGEANAVTREQIVRPARKGDQPGGTAMATTTTTAKIQKIDRSKREVTLKLPEGDSVIVKVDPSVGDLTRIHEGDRIKATYTEALGISVEPVK
jgi:hypothetical protein